MIVLTLRLVELHRPSAIKSTRLEPTAYLEIHSLLLRPTQVLRLELRLRLRDRR